VAPRQGTDVSEGFVRTVWFYLLQLGFIALMLAVAEAGFRLGRRATRRIPEKMRGQISVIEGSIIGVLALLLGFTLSMAVGRFEVRRQLVLQKANAIGTAYLRTKLLPDPEGADIASLLLRYLDAQIACSEAYGYGNPERDSALREDALRLQAQFWGRSAAWCRANPNEIASLISGALNQAIDLEAARCLAGSCRLLRVAGRPECGLRVSATM